MGTMYNEWAYSPVRSTEWAYSPVHSAWRYECYGAGNVDLNGHGNGNIVGANERITKDGYGFGTYSGQGHIGDGSNGSRIRFGHGYGKSNSWRNGTGELRGVGYGEGTDQGVFLPG